MKKRFVITVIYIIAVVAAATGKTHRFEHFTSRDGLPHQQIEALLFDSKGQLWIGTRNGLSNYDGYNFTNFFNDPSNSNSLNHNFIRTLFIDSKNRIWIGTNKGICRYRPATDDFKCYEQPNSLIQSITENSRGDIICSGKQLFVYNNQKDEFTMIQRQDAEFIISMAVDKKDNLFISTNKSIFYYDPSFTKTTQINPTYFLDFITGADGIIPLQFDSKGLLWIGRNGKGVMNINLTTGKSHIYNSKDISDGTVRVITEDHNKNIWLGTEKGLTIIHDNGEIEIIRQDYSRKNKLNDNAIYSIIPDSYGNMWIGTYFGGINVLFNDSNSFNWIEPGYSANELKGKAIRQIIDTGTGNLWIATEDGGLNLLNTSDKHISLMSKIPGLGQNIHCLDYDETTGEMWIGTFRNGLFKYNTRTGAYQSFTPHQNSGLDSDAIFDIVRTGKHSFGGGDRIWIATTQGLRYYDNTDKKFKKINQPALDRDFIYTLLVDKDGNLWAGTCNYGLFRIDSRTGEIINWSTKQKNTLLNDDYITCLYQDSKSRIWIGTNNEGVRFIDPLDMKIRALDNGLSLPQHSICSIIEDNAGGLWISTNDGLYHYNPQRTAMVQYTSKDGLPSNQFNFSSSAKDKNGTLYFGTVNGLVYFNPKALKERDNHPAVHFGHLMLDNSIVTADTPDSPLSDALDNMESISLSYAQSRSFSIEYGIISPANTNIVKYQVRLIGVNDNWRDAGQERWFVGLNLAPGTYELQVRANNPGTSWDQAPIKTLKIIIRPPFYRSNIAYIIYALLLITLIYFIYRFFEMRLHEKNEIKIANMEKDKLEEINKDKMDFFASVSHELKTPLSLIKAPLRYILQHNELNEESRQRLNTAIKNTDKMVGIIDELVTFNKIEWGNSQFYIQEGNPLDFIENAAMPFKESAAQKSVKLYIHCENNGEEVWFSPLYVERITNNLLSNALKFTPENGTISIKAEIVDNIDGFTYLRIEVKDSGIGITKDEIDNIFKKYYQTKRGYNVDNKGWGLGLALVKKFVEIHKGSINVESEPGKGSKFVVMLNVSVSAFDEKDKISKDKTIVPLEKYKFENSIQAESGSSSYTHETDKPSQDMQFSILIVEDNEDLLKFLSEYFAPEYNVYTAQNGKDALKIAQKYPIQLIISDIMMPEMDGYTLCGKLKSDISTSHIPVILLTAKGETEDMLKGYECGAEAYVVKPFDPQILDLQVKNIINTRLQKIDNIVNRKEPEEEAESHISKFDEEFINKINELIDKNIDNENFSVTDITKEMAISRSLLHVKMKSLLNTSTGDYIRKKRLELAKRLLREGYNVSETAYKTGFSDPNYFSKVFKREFELTPTEFIDNKQNQQTK